MIIICEDCGKKYRLDSFKLKGRLARFKCKACDHLIQLPAPEQLKELSQTGSWESKHTQAIAAAEEEPYRIGLKGIGDAHATATGIDPGRKYAQQSRSQTARSSINDSGGSNPETPLPVEKPSVCAGHSLRFKMMVLFFALPLILFGISSVLFLTQTNKLENMLIAESTKIVNRMAAEKIADLSRAVAAQCRLYLSGNPSLKKENFDKDVKFKGLAVQKVGTTGYTALYERPGKDGVWRTWSHVQPKIIGIDMANLKDSLGQNFAGFWQVFTGVKDGKESLGYYNWKDKDDRLRKKYMVCTPIEGTNYVIAATTYLEELSQSVNDLKNRSHLMAKQVRTTVAVILVATLFVIGAIVSFYSYRLTHRFRGLTKVAERISIGDMDAEISVRSKDEIGELAEAISRMQESLRLSIERLRSRRWCR